MTISQMLGQSGILTLLGMAVVFSFLIILICCMKLLNVFVRVTKLDQEGEEKTAGGSAAPASTGTAPATADNGAIVAAIATFIEKK